MSEQERRLGVYTVAPGPGQTRNCIDAWAMAFVRQDGRLDVCCYAATAGSLREGDLDRVVNSPAALALRTGLLTGELHPLCRNCPDKQVVPVEQLRQRVRRYLATADWGSDGTG